MIDIGSAKKRILNRVNIDVETGCWNWSLKLRKNGYARMTFFGDSWYAHRLSYIAFVGDFNRSMDVCHKCDNPKCVNPSHLFIGTRKDNMEDCVKKDRQAKGFMLPITKISERDKLDILDRAKNGEPYKDIAKDYGVCRQHIGKIALNNDIRRNNHERK